MRTNSLVLTFLLNLFIESQCFSMRMSSSSGKSSSLTKKNSFLNRRSFVVGTTSAIVPIYFGAWAPSDAEAASALPTTGVMAPEFKLSNSRGEETTLSDLVSKGKWTVLYFYPGAFTSGCTLEARSFQRDIASYRNLNTQIVGVSVDPVEKNAQFCQAESLDFFMLSDEGGKVSKAYGSAISIPGFGSFSNRQTYIIDPKGLLRHVFVDVESRVAKHSGEVLDKLKELQA